MKHLGWNEFEIGSLLFSFDEEVDMKKMKRQEDRKYSKTNSHEASVAHWRVEKPVFNNEHCINCYFCWIYCP
ncbi:MAG: pyruvate ferredoxin oxidoreductase, partial [Campylobacterales bacterium]